MSGIIKKVELNYRRNDGTIVSNLSAVESFGGHTANGRYFVGAYIHNANNDSGAFHLFEVHFLKNMFQVAELIVLRMVILKRIIQVQLRMLGMYGKRVIQVIQQLNG